MSLAELVNRKLKDNKHNAAPAKIALTLGSGLSKRMGFRPSHRIETSQGESKMDMCFYEVYGGSREAK